MEIPTLIYHFRVSRYVSDLTFYFEQPKLVSNKRELANMSQRLTIPAADSFVFPE
jgi:hypothetical protein